MPEIPSYGAPKVQREALPGVRFNTQASPQAFGSGIAAGIGDIGGAIGRIAVAERHKAIDLDVTAADTQLTAASNQIQQAAEERHGKDAFGAIEDSGLAYDKAADGIEKGMGTQEAKEAFRMRRAQRRVELDDRLHRHVSAERQRYDAQTTDSFIANSREAAAANFRDTPAVQNEIGRSQMEFIKHADRTGMDPETRKAGLAAIADDTHSTVIGQYIAAKDDRGALAYFQANRGEFSAKSAARLEGALKESTLRGEGQRQADAILAPLMDDENATRKQAYEEVKKITDPELRDAVQQRVDHLWGIHDDAIKATQENRYNGMIDAISGSKGDLAAVDAGEWSRLKAPEKKSLESYAAQLQKRAEPTTDWDVYLDLRSLAEDPKTRGEFLQVNLKRHLHELGGTELKELADLQQKMHAGNAAAVSGFYSREQLARKSLEDAGIDPDKKVDKKRAPIVKQFYDRLDTEVRAREAAEGKTMSEPELQQVIDSLLLQHTRKRPRSAWNPWTYIGDGVYEEQKYGFQLLDEGEGK